MEVKVTATDGTFWICPLYAFRCTVEGLQRIDLGGGVAIWRIAHELQQYLDERIDQLALAANEVEWVIQLPYYAKRREITETGMGTTQEQISYELSLLDDAVETAIDLVTSLRLQHKGAVAPAQLFDLKISKGEVRLGGTSCWSALSKSGYAYFVLAADQYQLPHGELDNLTGFWRHFQDKKRKGKISDLKIALRRFNSSYGEGPEDRLLDQMIALESLYLGDDKELRYKLALRAAFLLGAGKKERKQIFDGLKKAYDARGTIVHGGQLRGDPRELVRDTEEYLRKSIRRFIRLSDQYSLKQLRDRLLDQNILEASRLLRAR